MANEIDAYTILKEIKVPLYIAVSAFVGSLLVPVITYFFSSQYFERKKYKAEEEVIWGPTKEVLKELLDNAAKIGESGSYGRSFSTLKRVTGISDEQLRRLLISIDARGFTRTKDEFKNLKEEKEGEEAWCYKDKRPFKQQVYNKNEETNNLP